MCLVFVCLASGAGHMRKNMARAAKRQATPHKQCRVTQNNTRDHETAQNSETQNNAKQLYTTLRGAKRHTTAQTVENNAEQRETTQDAECNPRHVRKRQETTGNNAKERKLALNSMQEHTGTRSNT